MLDRLPTDKDYKNMFNDLNNILKPNVNRLAKIDHLVSFGIGIAKKDFRKMVMYFIMGHKTNYEDQQNIISRVMALPGITTDNVEFMVEEQKKGGKAFSGQKIRADKPRK